MAKHITSALLARDVVYIVETQWLHLFDGRMGGRVLHEQHRPKRVLVC